jgi:cobalt-zinc-cadmium resistance protein CzcA
MLGSLIDLSIRLRYMMLVLLALLLAGGVIAAKNLPIDAIPDISGIQVSVLTEAPGLSALEVERNVTFPMENALNGVPGMVELRSVSRADISAITIIFARRHRPVVRPPAGVRAHAAGQERPARDDPHPADRPAVHRPRRDLTSSSSAPRSTPASSSAPCSTGRSSRACAASPGHRGQHHGRRPQAVPGRRPARQARRLQPHDPRAHRDPPALERVVSGGYLDRGAESFTLRAVGMFTGLEDIGNVVLKTSPDGQPSSSNTSPRSATAPPCATA